LKRAAHAGLVAVVLAQAACGMGTQLAAGPVVGYVAKKGLSVGWEAGGGPMWEHVSSNATLEFPSLIARLNAGMSWRPFAPELLSYVAWEPWFLVGGSAGAAYSSADRQVHPLAGVWEAWLPALSQGTDEGWNRPPACSPCYTFTIALGWRWAAGSEVYLAPKVGFLNGIHKPWPYFSYAD
jgi:hypothetical protein